MVYKWLRDEVTYNKNSLVNLAEYIVSQKRISKEFINYMRRETWEIKISDVDACMLKLKYPLITFK